MSLYDVIIIGSGPAGVSAAYPLVENGLKVLMIDGGIIAKENAPTAPYTELRAKDDNQWQWLIGKDYYALKNWDSTSPKLRIPTHDYVFTNFCEFNKIKADNFVSIGSLATGGLSNTWGCGIAAESLQDLDKYPCATDEMLKSYAFVSKRIGISGQNNDDMASYFGVDDWSQPPIEMDTIHNYLYSRYQHKKKMISKLGFKLGRSRVAVLSRAHRNRDACELSGNCLWGCCRRALYSASEEVKELSAYHNFNSLHGLVVKQLAMDNGSWGICTIDDNQSVRESIRGRIILLAAGTLSTTRIAFKTLNFKKSVPLLSCPTAAFMAWVPRFLGRLRSNAFGLGQLSFNATVMTNVPLFGSTFSTSGIPVTEFIRYLPFHKRYSVDLMKTLLSSCIVGNVFFNSRLSNSKLTLTDDDSLYISGGYAENISKIMGKSEKLLSKAFRKLGAIILPGSFKCGKPGGDIHYAGTLPMRHNPVLGETNSNGEVNGLPNVCIVDGACLPNLSEKSHTLTIMANADRIGRKIVDLIKNT